MDVSSTRIPEFLARYGRARRKRQALVFFLSLLALCLVGLSLAALLQRLDLPLGWRRVLVGGGFASASLWALIFLGILPWRRLSDERHLARQIEARLGSADRRELLSAVELMRAAPAAGISPELLRAHLERVELELAAHRPESLAPGQALRRVGLSLLLAGLLAALSGTLWPQDFLEGFSSLWRSDRSRSLRSSQESWVAEIQLRYRYPAYARRPDRQVPASDGSILALRGSRVELSLRTDRPVRAGRLEGLESGPVLLKVAGERELRGQLVVDRPGSYRFVIEDLSGESWRAEQACSVMLEPDRVPRVQLEKPAKDRVVQPDEAVELLFDAEDDFGLSAIDLVWRIVGRAQVEQRKKLWRSEAMGKSKHRQQLRWELSDLQLQPGEQLQFAVEARDDDEVSGPKAGRSRSLTFKVFSAEERHRELMAEVQVFWERLLAVLADHLEGEAGVRRGAETRAEHDELSGGLERIGEDLEPLRRALAADSLAWEPLLQALALVDRRLRDMQRNLDFLLRHAGQPAASGLKEAQARTLAEARSRRIVQLEQDVLYLEDLLDLERLEDLERIGKELERAQARLADLMERYRKAPSEEGRREILSAIAQLKEQIARLMARQSEVIKSLRDEYLNPEALARLASDRDMLGALDELQRKMNEGRLDEAMAEMERLAKQLQNMREAVDRARSTFGQERYRELAEKVSELRGELEQIAERQKDLAEATGRIRDKALERLRQRLARDWPALRKKLLARLEEVQAGLEGLGQEGVFGYMRFDRDMALERARGLKQLLEADDVAAASGEARALRRYSERMEQGLRAEAAMQRQLSRLSASLRAELERAESARKGAEEIAKALDAIVPEPERLLDGQERKRVDRMNAQQAELGRRMGAIEQQMNQLNKKAPVFGPQMGLGVQQGRRFMQQAGGALQRRDAPGAWSHQQAAMKELERLQKSMDQAGKQCEQGGMPLPMGYRAGHQPGEGQGGMSREPVEIPKAEDYEPPEAFRKELLEGMKDPVPEDYESQVRHYYEELVR